MNRRNKNISQNIRLGSVIQTRDEYFKNGVPKSSFANSRAYYRGAVVVETNKKDEIGVVKFVSSGSSDVKINNRPHKYRPFLEVYDNKNNFIKLGNKFILNNSKHVSSQDVIKIKKELYVDNTTPKRLRKKNTYLVRKLKGR